MTKPLKTMLAAICLMVSPIMYAEDNSEAPRDEAHGGIAWGANIATGIDMGGDDMSTLNLHACFGYQNGWFRIAGVGVGIDAMMSNSCRSFPIYAIVQTSFQPTPRLLFGDFRAGIAYNQAPGVPDRANLYLQPGIGIQLAKGSTFSSYLSLSYTYNGMSFYGDQKDTIVHNLHRTTVSIGVTF
ncbi:MAG: hypothetical protein K2H87_06785 [Duncaniella sp.]|nr:hypothetical protein [Duncaniella sp.]